jgi:hypothetical protein
MLLLRRLGVVVLLLLFLLITFYGLALALYYNQPDAYSSDGEFPLFLLGWFGVGLVLVGSVGLLVLYRFRSRLS